VGIETCDSDRLDVYHPGALLPSFVVQLAHQAIPTTNSEFSMAVRAHRLIFLARLLYLLATDPRVTLVRFVDESVCKARHHLIVNGGLKCLERLFKALKLPPVALGLFFYVYSSQDLPPSSTTASPEPHGAGAAAAAQMPEVAYMVAQKPSVFGSDVAFDQLRLMGVQRSQPIPTEISSDLLKNFLQRRANGESAVLSSEPAKLPSLPPPPPPPSSSNESASAASAPTASVDSNAAAAAAASKSSSILSFLVPKSAKSALEGDTFLLEADDD